MYLGQLFQLLVCALVVASTAREVENGIEMHVQDQLDQIRSLSLRGEGYYAMEYNSNHFIGHMNNILFPNRSTSVFPHIKISNATKFLSGQVCTLI